MSGILIFQQELVQLEVVLEKVVGSVKGVNRWNTFLTAGSRTAQEFAEAWNSIRLEAQQCCNYLGKELEGELSVVLVKAGGEKDDGSTRRAVVQQRQGLRHEVLSKSLERHGDRQARPVTVFQQQFQQDKWSMTAGTAWARQWAVLSSVYGIYGSAPLSPLSCCDCWWFAGESHSEGWGGD